MSRIHKLSTEGKRQALREAEAEYMRLIYAIEALDVNSPKSTSHYAALMDLSTKALGECFRLRSLD